MKAKWWLFAGAGLFLLLLVTGKLYDLLVLGVGVVAFGLPVILIGGAILLFISAKKGRIRFNEKNQRENVESILAKFGSTPEERRAEINRRFDAKAGNIGFDLDRRSSSLNGGWAIKLHVGRNLASMSPRHLEALRTTLLLANEGVNLSPVNTDLQLLGLIWGEGKGNIYDSKVAGLNKSRDEALSWYIGGDTSDAMVDLTLRDLQNAVKNHPDNPTVRVLAARLLGTGQDLFVPSGLATAAPDALPGDFLILGGSEGDSALHGYAGEGSLITIAPTRCGKSQCHVIPNLLNWDGPAVVLDVKNELFKATSGWRAANVGPVFKFSPLSKTPSHRYNPITEVSDDPNSLWEDSRFLADMLIVPSGSREPFWETRARDILRAAIAHVVYYNPPPERGMDKVLDIMHGVEWERFLSDLGASDIPAMKRAGKSLSEMQPQMKASVLQTALTSLACWEGTLIADATAVSDWRPADLKGPGKPTIYICVRPNEVESYISVLRVMIAQHIRRLIADDPEQNPKTVLFLLDELPRLRHMPPVEEALEIGAQYGIKIWMFAQTVGQMETAYDNADGMIGGCAVRCFMNPGMQDDLAQDISEQFGFRESVVDGTRVKVVEPTTLAGPDFKDKVIVMATSATPGVLEKRPAYANETLAARMAIPPAVIEVPDDNR